MFGTIHKLCQHIKGGGRGWRMLTLADKGRRVFLKYMLGKGLSSMGLVIWAIGQKNDIIHCYGISDDGVIEACLGSGFLFLS